MLPPFFLQITDNIKTQVAERIAKEMEVPLGTVVGLRHRDHDTTNDWTHLEVHSDGELDFRDEFFSYVPTHIV